ncbi:hypothetical protein K3495_g4308 [Podosphaera aphanis]|nr:hypothetical protein K3495_g4308 [Podosphaera aphanis]
MIQQSSSFSKQESDGSRESVPTISKGGNHTNPRTGTPRVCKDFLLFAWHQVYLLIAHSLRMILAMRKMPLRSGLKG